MHIGVHMAESKGSFLTESLMQLKKYSKSLSWAEKMNKLFAVMGGKFKSSAQDSDLSCLELSDKKQPFKQNMWHDP